MLINLKEPLVLLEPSYPCYLCHSGSVKEPFACCLFCQEKLYPSKHHSFEEMLMKMRSWHPVFPPLEEKIKTTPTQFESEIMAALF